MRDAQRFAEEYMEKVFYFALKKTGNESDADDLAEDIAEAVLAGLSRGAEPENFDAWVWAVARNRWTLFGVTPWMPFGLPPSSADMTWKPPSPPAG